MPFVTGRPERLKISSFLGIVYVRDEDTGQLEPFVLWRDLTQASAFDRILQTSWVGLVRDALQNDLTLRVLHLEDSAFVEQLELLAPPQPGLPVVPTPSRGATEVAPT